jgi:hypothetical protein
MIRSLSAVPLLALLPFAAATGEGSTAPVVICLAPTSVEATTGTAATLMNAVSETFTTFLSGPTIEIKPLSARLKSQARVEAKAAGCPYLLLTTVSHVHKTGGGGILSRAAGAALSQGAWAVSASAGSSVGGIAGSVIAGAAGAAVSDFAGSVKTKDELTLTYRLEAAGTALIEKKEKRSAKSDGQDLLTPIAEKASEAIATAVTTRR